jgi:hypothetical protein
MRIGLLLVLLLSLLAGQASAATVVGENFVPTMDCGANRTFLQTESPGSSYTIPKRGVVTSWTISGPSSGSLTAAFKVARESPPGSNSFIIVGSSANHTAVAGSSFTGNLSYRVEAGDVVGLYVTSGLNCIWNQSGYTHRIRNGEHHTGGSTYADSQDDQTNVSAVLEDDADGDGLGDESQDSDDDNDAAPDATDNCPGLANADQANSDGAPDGGDACDADDDNDGLTDAEEALRGSSPVSADGDGDGRADTADNCPAASNAGQEDFDLDGIGDPCDPPTPGACANPHTGTDLADRITGTIGGDRISALGGRDAVNGLAGADCIGGGGESDKLTGGEGADTLGGADGADRLSGGSGKDKLTGGDDADRLTGGAGKNAYSAGDGNDTVNSVNGNRETVNCGPGIRDKVTADPNDRLRGCERVKRRSP